MIAVPGSGGIGHIGSKGKAGHVLGAMISIAPTPCSLTVISIALSLCSLTVISIPLSRCPLMSTCQVVPPNKLTRETVSRSLRRETTYPARLAFNAQE